MWGLPVAVGLQVRSTHSKCHSDRHGYRHPTVQKTEQPVLAATLPGPLTPIRRAARPAGCAEQLEAHDRREAAVLPGARPAAGSCWLRSCYATLVVRAAPSGVTVFDHRAASLGASTEARGSLTTSRHSPPGTQTGSRGGRRTSSSGAHLDGQASGAFSGARLIRNSPAQKGALALIPAQKGALALIGRRA